MLVQKVRKIDTQGLLYVWYMYQYSYLVEQVEVLLSQTVAETRLTDRYKSTDSLSFVTPANFPRAVTVANEQWWVDS